jgi:hypothetical protein
MQGFIAIKLEGMVRKNTRDLLVESTHQLDGDGKDHLLAKPLPWGHVQEVFERITEGLDYQSVNLAFVIVGA